jgi:leader peptidase (prepilin peptidase)/N-methyltransferase
MSGGAADFGQIAAGGNSSRELLVAGLAGFAATVESLHVAPGWDGVAGSALAVIMIAIAIADLRRMIIPDVLSLTAAALGFITIVVESSADDRIDLTIEAAMRSAAMVTVFLVFRHGYRWVRGWEGMGLGDVKLAGVAGVWLQVGSLPSAIEIAACSGVALALVWRWRSGAGFAPLVKVPFGMFLAPTIWLCWLFERW